MPKLTNRRDALLAKLVSTGDFIKGSITCVCAKCARANCACSTKSNAKAYRLTYKDDHQKTQTVFIPRNRLSKMKRLTANYSKVRKLIQQIIATNIAIFKKGDDCL